MVDPVDAQQVQRCRHIVPGRAELSGMGGGLETGRDRERVGLGKHLGRAVHLVVVDADPENAGLPVVDHRTHHLDRLFGRGFPVDARDQPAGDAEIPSRLAHASEDGGLQVAIGEIGMAERPGRVPEYLGVAHRVDRDVFEILVSYLAQVLRRLQDMPFELAEDVQDADRLLAADIEPLDLVRCGAGAVPGRDVLHRLLPDGAQKVTMDLHLGDPSEKRLQIAHCPDPPG